MLMAPRMKLYTVHVRPGETAADISPVFIKEGFCLPAFIIPLPWALYQRLWLVAAGLVAYAVLLSMLTGAHVIGQLSAVLLHLAMNAALGFHANDFLRARLARRGYILSDVTAADSYLRAQQRYFERYVAAVS